MNEHRGALILVLGILSLILCQPLGFVAWVLANNDLREMDAGMMDRSGRDLTVAGKICGMIGAILFILGIIVGLIFLLIAAAGALIGS